MRDDASERPEASPPTAARARVLIADDHAPARTMLRELLADEGYDVATAEDGLAAIALLESFGPDLVITDLSMPQLDGMGLIRALREKPRFAQVPVIVVSAHYDASHRVSASRDGADDFLTKPIDFDQLLACVDRHLRGATTRLRGADP